MPPANDALVLLGAGASSQINALQAEAAGPLAQALGLKLRAPLAQAPCTAATAQQLLQELPAASLAPLPIDPGIPLAGHGHWAEQLGAARQCCLLVLHADQATSGTPAALTALLLQWRVPLVGLIQWGAPWLEADRSQDGLPWLGWMAAIETASEQQQASEAAVALALSIQLRWQLLRSR